MLQGLTDHLEPNEHRHSEPNERRHSEHRELEQAGQGLGHGRGPEGGQGLGPGQGLTKVLSLDDIAEMAKTHQQQQHPPGTEPSSLLVLSSGAR